MKDASPGNFLILHAATEKGRKQTVRIGLVRLHSLHFLCFPPSPFPPFEKQLMR
jgi:hypothetical protein